MATSQPKPAKGGAESHRQQDDEEDRAPPVTPDLGGPEDRDGGGGGGGDPPASPGSGATGTFGVSKKQVALLIGAAVAAFLLWQLWKNREALNDTVDQAQTEHGTEPQEDEINPEDGPQIVRDPDDPLAADHEALQWVFGDRYRERGS